MTSRLVLGIGDNLLDAILGYAVVFIGLTLLMTVIVIVGKVFTAKKAAPAAETAAPAAAAPAAPKKLAPGSAGDVKIYDTDPRDAAMIMAIVADKLGKPLNELRFRSIKEVK
ncbi:MAG: OadG family protein [Clostridia bacterium]|nr:OadG family protein [Clostridia bacterium]